MTSTTTIALPSEVVTFWFGETVRPLWFAATAEFDQALRERFLATYQAAAAGERADWEITPEGALALVIVLDQFPLNMFRGRPEAFATETAARKVAERAIVRGLDQALPSEQQTFLYMPFMHSEDPSGSGALGAPLPTAGAGAVLGLRPPSSGADPALRPLSASQCHPGAANTAEEIAYLASPEAFLG
jgi:hypothetical protein